MHVVLATGIYPPEIGGPATYVAALARELTARGNTVVVVTYVVPTPHPPPPTLWQVVGVARGGGVVLRYLRYARVLRAHARDADIVYAFSAVSAGVPIVLARLRRPKKVLRLGGDFLWERYTDWGGRKTLREFYGAARRQSSSVSIAVVKTLYGLLLRRFDCVVFSTRFQEEIYERAYRRLPPHTVIENAFSQRDAENPEDAATSLSPRPVLPYSRTPVIPCRFLRLLWVGRMVGFKNLSALIRAVSSKVDAETSKNSEVVEERRRNHGAWALTIVGSGPLEAKLKAQSSKLKAPVTFLPPAHGATLRQLFAEYDLLVLPSLTEISPNIALEARAAGLPVLLTEETGLSPVLARGMVLRPLRSPDDIVQAIAETVCNYAAITAEADTRATPRPWSQIVTEHLDLFHSLVE